MLDKDLYVPEANSYVAPGVCCIPNVYDLGATSCSGIVAGTVGEFQKSSVSYAQPEYAIA